jgi:mannose-6-phosphate isomerase-like protein (cupin superfamily)
MKVILNKDHKVIETETCGQIRELLSGGEQPGLDLALALDIRPTKAHFHKMFDEIYLVLDGVLTLQTYDPSTGSRKNYELQANELCVVTRGVHHQII